MLVSEYLDFVADLREMAGPQRRGALDQSVQATAIEEKYYRPIGELSKGFKQRVGLAAAILHRPDLLVLDEPTEGLDPNQRLEIRHLISHLGKDRTVMLSTHVLPEVQETCSRLLIIHQGRIAADGPVDQLMAQARGQVQILVEVEGAGVAEALGGLPGVARVERTREIQGRAGYTLSADGRRDLRPEIFRIASNKGWTLYELHQESATVEDLFRQLTAAPESEATP
jgi:ABC-2 type transport system ATP-binding protein